MHDLDHHDELAELARALRAHAEWQALTGATGLERATAAHLAARSAGAPAPGDAAALDASRPQVVVEAAAASPARVVGSQTTAHGPNEDAVRRLDVLCSEVSSCTRCALHRERTQAVFARGTGKSGLCFVGEGPGADEDAQGFPFVGKAGQLLDRMIAAMGLERDDVYVCNIVKCRPPKNRKPEPDEAAACRPYLTEQLELVNPSVIVALGATAVEGLLGISGGITRLRGTWRLYAGRVPVMPTFHPAYLLRTPEAKREVWSDLQEVLRHMGRDVPKRTNA